jgi:hypothetical protein
MSNIISRSFEDELAYKMLRALAFLPINEVSGAFNALKEYSSPDFKPLLDYFETNYVNGSSRSLNRRVRHTPPRYSPSLWSIYDNLINGVETTTNKLECWHGRMKIIIGRSHVNVNILIKHLHAETAVIRNTIANSLAGNHSSQSNKNHEKKVNNLKFIMENKDNYNSSFDYLKSIAKNI